MSIVFILMSLVFNSSLFISYLTLCYKSLNIKTEIEVIHFEWSEKQSVHTGKDVGVIAQEVQKVLPEVVTEREDGYLAVKYEKIIPLLIEAIKDQQKEIEELKSKIK